MIDARALAAHVLVHLARARGRRAATIAELAEALGVRREDVRAVVTRLHREGFVDATRLRLTLGGLTLASALGGCKLRAIRRPALGAARAA